MGIQSICKVKANVTPVNPDGTQGAAAEYSFFFRGSNVYKASTDIKTASGIEHIPQQFWDGDLPLVPVADLIREGIIARIGVVVKNPTTNKKRKYQLVVDAEQRGAIFNGTGTANLIQKDFILTGRNGTARNIGKIVKIQESTDAYNP